MDESSHNFFVVRAYEGVLLVVDQKVTWYELPNYSSLFYSGSRELCMHKSKRYQNLMDLDGKKPILRQLFIPRNLGPAL